MITGQFVSQKSEINQMPMHATNDVCGEGSSPTLDPVIGSANVRTLCATEDGAMSTQVSGTILTSRIQTLDLQFQNESVKVVGIQEGRLKHVDVQQGFFFDMFFAGAYPNGTAGV